MSDYAKRAAEHIEAHALMYSAANGMVCVDFSRAVPIIQSAIDAATADLRQQLADARLILRAMQINAIYISDSGHWLFCLRPLPSDADNVPILTPELREKLTRAVEGK